MPSTHARVASLLFAAAILSAAIPASAQHPAFRIKGKIKNDANEPIGNAEVRIEAFYGYYGAAFGGGQRTFGTTTNAKGDWSIGGLQPGVWLVEVFASNYVPETIVLPIRIITTVSEGTAGMSLPWDLVLKPVKARDDEFGRYLGEVLQSVRAGKADVARDALAKIPAGADGDYLAGAGRVALAARDFPLARTLFLQALDRDPSSFRAALGVASLLLYDRNFDAASRAFDAARSRTHDKEEQRFLSIALTDLAQIKVR